MNIFGVGGAEFILIVLIMIVVAGPQRMIRWMYHLGRYVAVLQRMWEQTRLMLQREFDEAGVDVKVPERLPDRQSMRDMVQNAAKPYTDEVRAPLKEAQNEVKRATSVAEMREEMNQMSDEVRNNLRISANPNAYARPKAQPAPSAPMTAAQENHGKGDDAATADETAAEAPANGFGAWSRYRPPED